ncbi:FecR family protein [Mangrovibacterium diazotrophicum]|nr:FecR domain-containing protein [Mangrovibacterium diazotrophicum]
MTKVKEQIKIAGLLARKMLGMLTEEQLRDLQKWEEAGDNRKVEADILQPGAFDAWNKQMDNLDVSTQWTMYLNRMQRTTTRKKVIRLNIIRTVSAVAAMLVLAVSIGIVWKLTTEKPQKLALAEVSIEPGSKNAQLFLDNGQVIDLKAADAKSIDEGDVKIENNEGVLVYNDSQVAENKETAAKAKYVTNRLSIPRGGEYQLVLPDGSRVWLNSESELTYTVPFSPNERHVNLKGEAYFEVAHNKDKPFTVSTPSQTIEVLGTQFDVSAYSDDESIVTTLVEGKVKVEYKNSDKGTEVTYLAPNDQLVLNTETSAAKISQVDTHVYTAWKDGRFVFRNEPLESLLKTVARWYDVQIKIEDESVKAIHFTGDLPRYKNMNSLLKILETETSVHVEMSDDKILTVTK